MKNKVEAAAVRDEICRAISVAGMSSQHSFLSFAGILPLNLPDGTRGVVLPDLHIPAHYRPLLWPITQLLHRVNPHLLISIGDLGDIFALARHPKGLRVPTDAQGEFTATRRVWDHLVDASGCYWNFVINGNHEDRIWRFLQDMAPQLGGIIDPHTREPISFHSALGYTAKDNMTFLYGTDERGGFEGGLLMNNALGAHHGIMVRPKAGASPLADMDKWIRSIMQGHTHRFGFVARDVAPTENIPTGVLMGTELGMLVDLNHAYMGYAKNMWPNWHMGLATFTVYNGIPILEHIPITPVEHKGVKKLGFVYNRELFVEDDR